MCADIHALRRGDTEWFALKKNVREDSLFHFQELQYRLNILIWIFSAFSIFKLVNSKFNTKVKFYITITLSLAKNKLNKALYVKGRLISWHENKNIFDLINMKLKEIL